MPTLTPRAKLMAGRHIAKQKLPYFRRALNSMVFREQPELGTIGITPRMVALYDPVAIERWTVGEIAWVLCHEVMHPLRESFTRCEKHAGEHRLWNIAHDMEINDDLVLIKPEQPGDYGPDAKDREFRAPKASPPVLPQTLGFKPGSIAEDYYNRLAALGRGSTPDQSGNGSGREKGEAQKAGEKAAEMGAKPGAGTGWCGSGGGQAVPGEPDEDAKDSTGRQVGKSEPEIRRIRRETAEAIREEASKGRGDVPAGLQRWADAELKPPKISWEQELAHSIRGLVQRAGVVDYTYRRTSVRQAGLGFGPGKPRLAGFYEFVPNVAFVVDTSGSMGVAELNRAMAEASGVLAVLNASVAFLTCDATVHTAVRAASWQEAAAQLKGGGGTDFCPVFEYLAGLPPDDTENPRPDVIIIVTDGQGPAPAEPPPWASVIWLLVGPYQQHPCEWGKFISIDETNDG